MATAKNTASKREKEKGKVRATVKEKDMARETVTAKGMNPTTTRKARGNPPPASPATRPRVAGVNSGWE